MREAERGKIPIFGSGSNPWVPRTIKCKKYGPSKARTTQKWVEGEHVAITPSTHQLAISQIKRNLLSDQLIAWYFECLMSKWPQNFQI